jgi:hypothetical protein
MAIRRGTTPTDASESTLPLPGGDPTLHALDHRLPSYVPLPQTCHQCGQLLVTPVERSKPGLCPVPKTGASLVVLDHDWARLDFQPRAQKDKYSRTHLAAHPSTRNPRTKHVQIDRTNRRIPGL